MYQPRDNKIGALRIIHTASMILLLSQTNSIHNYVKASLQHSNFLVGRKLIPSKNKKEKKEGKPYCLERQVFWPQTCTFFIHSTDRFCLLKNLKSFSRCCSIIQDHFSAVAYLKTIQCPPQLIMWCCSILVVNNDSSLYCISQVCRNKDGSISLKLADFGLAMEVKENIYTVCGTPTYVAPEILAETGQCIRFICHACHVFLFYRGQGQAGNIRDEQVISGTSR